MRSTACSTCRSSRPTSTRRRCARASPSSGPARIPKTILDDVAAQWDALTDRIGVDKQRAAYEAWAEQAQRLPDGVVSQGTAPALAGGRLSRLADRQFKYLAITPAVVIILLIGLFPIVYSAVVSFQNINMLEEDTSFSGLLNYQRLLADARFWQALGHTFIFLAVALPVELVLGLLLAYLFLDRMPGPADLRGPAGAAGGDLADRRGAMWSLLFDNRFGPINQILGWIAGQEVTILWTVNPALVYPAILTAEIWQWTPFMFLLLLAALSNVDKSQLEAAEIDGAGFCASPSARSSCRPSGRCWRSPS